MTYTESASVIICFSMIVWTPAVLSVSYACVSVRANVIICFSMIFGTPAVLSVLYACVSYFCTCTCSAQLSVFHMVRRSRNTLIITIIISVKIGATLVNNAIFVILLNSVLFRSLFGP